jgi:sulfate permease, SulP family
MSRKEGQLARSIRQGGPDVSIPVEEPIISSNSSPVRNELRTTFVGSFTASSSHGGTPFSHSRFQSWLSNAGDRHIRQSLGDDESNNPTNNYNTARALQVEIEEDSQSEDSISHIDDDDESPPISQPSTSHHRNNNNNNNHQYYPPSLNLSQPLLQACDDEEQATGGPGPARGRNNNNNSNYQTTREGQPSNPPIVHKHSSLRPETSTSTAITFGLINTVAGIPALIAFCAIVFRDDIYEDHLQDLAKLFFLASAIQQTVSILLSGLSFAVCQVQDVGIIFLSAMATSIAGITTASSGSGDDDAAALAVSTSLLLMCIATFLVGLGSLFITKARLYGFVNYLPLPVVGGYLGYVGLFCMLSGIEIAMETSPTGGGTSITTTTTAFTTTTNDPHDATPVWAKLVMMGLACSSLIFVQKISSSPLALPTMMAAIVGSFHLIWTIAGIDKTDWVMPPPADSGKPFWKIYELFDLSLLASPAFYTIALRQLPIMAGLFLVVFFGSAMDVIAIQQETGPDGVSFDTELTSISVANMAAAVAGAGFTGSFIFSQTIFTMKSGITSKLNGYVIAGAEFFCFFAPVSFMQYIPNFFYGALLCWFGIEISKDWLLASYFKMSLSEYGILLLTFASITWLGLELGILAGILFAVMYFTYAYSTIQAVSLRVGKDARKDGVVRPVDQAAALKLFYKHCLAVAHMNGFLFFGSAYPIGEKLQHIAESISIEQQQKYGNNDLGGVDINNNDNNNNGGGGLKYTISSATISALTDPQTLAPHPHHQNESASARTKQPSPFEPHYNNSNSNTNSSSGRKFMKATSALAQAPRFLIFDFDRLNGLDSTGARTIGTICRDLGRHGITPIIAGTAHAPSIVRTLLTAHGLDLVPVTWPPADIYSPSQSPPSLSTILYNIEEGRGGHEHAGHEMGGGGGVKCLEFAHSTTDALRFCSDQFLQVAVTHHLCSPPTLEITLEQIFSLHLTERPFPSITAHQAAAMLEPYVEKLVLQRGQVLWKLHDPARHMYIIESGVVRVDQYSTHDPTEDENDDGGGNNGGGTGVARRESSMSDGGGGGTMFLHGSHSWRGPSLPSHHHHHCQHYHQGGDGGCQPNTNLPQPQARSGKYFLVRSWELGAGCVAGATSFYLSGKRHSSAAMVLSERARVLRLEWKGMEEMAKKAPEALNVLQLFAMRANTSDLAAAAAGAG